MFRIVFSLCLLAFSSMLNAANESIPVDRTITTIRAYHDHIVVHFSPAYDNSQNCNGGYTGRVFISVDDVERGSLRATVALSAYLSNQKVGFGIGGCSEQHNGMPKVYRVDVKP